MIEPQHITVVAAAVVAVWWLADWLTARSQGRPLPMRRAPLRALGDVLSKLWRNKSFMLALLSLWLIGATVASVRSYVMRLGAERPPASVAPRLTGPLPEALPRLFAGELPEALPRLVQVPLGTWAAILFAVLLVTGMVRIIIDPPDHIGQATAGRLRWPVGMLAFCLAAGVALVAAPREFRESFGYGGPTPPMRTFILSIGTMVLLPALFAPAHALLWRLVLEIARDGAWSFVSSMRALAESWLPITVVVIIAHALRPIVTHLAGGSASVWSVAYLVVLVLLALVPWAVLDRRTGLLAALTRSWWLVRLRPLDVFAFGLRFALLFGVLGLLVALFEPQAWARWATWYAPLLAVVRNGLLVLQALVLARLYVHLSEELSITEAPCEDV